MVGFFTGSSVTRSARMKRSIFERTCMNEGAALVDRRGIVRRERRKLLDARALPVGAVARAEAQVRSPGVVPPFARVVRDAVDDGVPDARSEEGDAHELREVVVA